MSVKYIHVNQHIIRSNKKNNANEPVLTKILIHVVQYTGLAQLLPWAVARLKN